MSEVSGAPTGISPFTIQTESGDVLTLTTFTPYIEPAVLAVDKGFIKVDTSEDIRNPDNCFEPEHLGRLVAQDDGTLWICAGGGWRGFAPVFEG